MVHGRGDRSIQRRISGARHRELHRSGTAAVHPDCVKTRKLSENGASETNFCAPPSLYWSKTAESRLKFINRRSAVRVFRRSALSRSFGFRIRNGSSCPIAAFQPSQAGLPVDAGYPGEGDAASPAGHYILDRGDVVAFPLDPITLRMAGSHSRSSAYRLAEVSLRIRSTQTICLGWSRLSQGCGRSGFYPAQKTGHSTDRSQHHQYQHRPLRQRPTVPSQPPDRTSPQ
jgi:hypothetical protein